MHDYHHILAAVDFSDSAQLVLKKALEIARRNNAQLSLLHIVEYLPPIDTAYEPILSINWGMDENQLLERARQTLVNFSEKHNASSAKLYTQLGSPKHEISQFVLEHDCDLVILGSHGRHGINILLGSTANALLNMMPCDVLALKIT